MERVSKRRIFMSTIPPRYVGLGTKPFSIALPLTIFQHSYMKLLYKYPQNKFPYEDLVKENAARGKEDREYQLIDTGIFEEDRYWDIVIETAKEAHDPDELLFRVTAWNRGPEPAPLHIIPHVWFRNCWAWGHEPDENKPSIRQVSETVAQTKHYKLGERYFQLSPSLVLDPAARMSSLS